jgi:RNA polymerase sigma factor (sigma-70 family)
MSLLANEISKLSDDELLDWYRGSNEASTFIAESYRRFSEDVYFNAIKWLKDMPDFKEAAKDVRADVFIKIAILVEANKLKARRIQPYLFVITRNKCLALIKKGKRVSKFNQTIEKIESEVMEIEKEENSLRSINETNIMDHVRELDEKKQQIITLRFFYNMTTPQISEIMKLKATTVRGHWQYALKKLQEKTKK